VSVETLGSLEVYKIVKKVLLSACLTVILIGCSRTENSKPCKFHQDASELWGQGKYEEALTLQRKAIKLQPNNAACHYALAKILLDNDNGNIEESMKELQLTLTLKPRPKWVTAWANIEIGKIYCRIGKKSKSRDYFRKALEIKATSNSIKKAKEWLKRTDPDTFKEWLTFESRYFIIHFSSNILIKNAIKKYAIAMDAAFEKNSEFLGQNLEDKVNLHIYNSFQDIKEKLHRYESFADIRLKEIHTPLYQELVVHELTHVLSYYINPKWIVTDLLGEGLSEYLDQSGRNWYNIVVSDILQSENFVPLQKLMDRHYFTTSKHRLYNYAEAASFVGFLIEVYGIEKFKRLWKTQGESKGIKSVYGRTITHIEKDWLNYIKQKEKTFSWIGVKLGHSGENILISEVTENSSAERAGLKEGDIITEVNSRRFYYWQVRELIAFIQNMEVSKKVNLTVVRNGKKEIIPVILEEKPVENTSLYLFWRFFAWNIASHSGLT